MSTAWRHAVRALRHRDYRLYFTGQLVSFVGTWLQTSGLYWLVFEQTRDESALGATAFWGGLASFVSAGVAGGLLDRVPRRSAVIATQALSLVQSLILFGLCVSGAASFGAILLLSLGAGLINGVDLPARQALVGEVTPRDDLPSAIALSSSAFNLARVVGPSLGGLLLARYGAAVCFALNALSFAWVLWALVRMKGASSAPSTARGSAWASLREAASYAWHASALRDLLALIGLASMAGSYFALLPAFAAESLHLDARGYGLLGGMPGLGSVAAAFVVALRRGGVSGPQVLAGACLFGGGMIGAALAPSLAWALPGMTLVGFGMTLMYASANSLVQGQAPAALRGRVAALYTMSFSGATPLGALLLGHLAAWKDPALAFTVGGAGVILSALLFSRSSLRSF